MKYPRFYLLIPVIAFFAYGQVIALNDAPKTPMMENGIQTKTAVFAGGCFWCVESDFEKLPGVLDAVAGYTGGDRGKPHLRAGVGRRHRACGGRSGHL